MYCSQEDDSVNFPVLARLVDFMQSHNVNIYTSHIHRFKPVRMAVAVLQSFMYLFNMIPQMVVSNPGAHTETVNGVFPMEGLNLSFIIAKHNEPEKDIQVPVLEK